VLRLLPRRTSNEPMIVSFLPGWSSGVDVSEIDVAEAVLPIGSLPDGILAGTDGVTLRGSALPAAPGLLARGPRIEASSAPHQVEGIALAAAFGILNPDNDRAPAIPRVLDQVLPSAPIHADEPEIRRIGGHRPGTYKPAPL
jgi:hypothetical protein